MTKNEALKAAIDGKKIQHNEWANDFYFYFDGNKFCTNSGADFFPSKANKDNVWQIVPEYVSFTEAWKAFENGKIVQSTQTGNKKKKSDNILQKFDEHEIRGKWLILEDE